MPLLLHKTLLHVATQQEGIHKPRLDQLLEVRVLEAFWADPSQPTQGSLGRKQKRTCGSHWAPQRNALPSASLKCAVLTRQLELITRCLSHDTLVAILVTIVPSSPCHLFHLHLSQCGRHHLKALNDFSNSLTVSGFFFS